MRNSFALLVPGALLLLGGCVNRAVVMDSRAAEAPPVLKQAYVLQEAFREENGRYATSLAELQSVGWQDPRSLQQYQLPRVVRARGDQLCIEMQPRHSGLPAHHIDQSGDVRQGPCP